MDTTYAANRPARRRAFAPLLALLLLSLLAPSAAVFAQSDEDAPLALSEMPSTGAARSGPIRLAPSATGREADIAVGEPADEEALEGVPPVAIQIDTIGVDAEIERVEIVDGVMQNPSGPWVVSWYEDLSAPGEENNVVMAGHVDYWDTGPAVLWALGDLTEGDVIEVYGEDGEVYEYAFDWMRDYAVADLDADAFNEIIGPTDDESLTIITCAIGTWDPVALEYTSRTVLRATEV